MRNAIRNVSREFFSLQFFLLSSVTRAQIAITSLSHSHKKVALLKSTIDPYCWNEILTLRGKFTQQNKWHVIAFLWEIKGKWTKVSYSERKSHFHSPVFDWLFKEFIICPFKIANIFPLSLWNEAVFLSRIGKSQKILLLFFNISVIFCPNFFG